MRRSRPFTTRSCRAGIAVLGLLLVPVATPLLAHDGETHAGAPGWTLDPLIIVPLLLLLGVYVAGAIRLGARTRSRRTGALPFIAGWTVLFGALVSPLHEGGEMSFTLHMIEHELIMLVATLLIAAAHPAATLAWGLPAPARSWLASRWTRPFRQVGRWLARPVTATVLQAVAMWAWHAPALFDRALESRGWHIAQHASFILTSLLFWSAMLGARRGGYGLAAACLFATSVIGGMLGALMALSQSPWYAGYAAMELSGIGLDPATDQQLAGLLMWIPGGLVHFTAAFILLYRWLKSEDDGQVARQGSS